MAMMTLLTLTAMFGTVRQTVPHVSYVTFLDIWMVFSMLFVFLSLVEFIVVSHYIKNGRKRVAECIETISRLLIPALFLIFNMIYWPNLYRNECA